MPIDATTYELQGLKALRSKRPEVFNELDFSNLDLEKVDILFPKTKNKGCLDPPSNFRQTASKLLEWRSFSARKQNLIVENAPNIVTYNTTKAGRRERARIRKEQQKMQKLTSANHGGQKKTGKEEETASQRLKDLDTPAFIVNRHAFRQNCDKVGTAAYANGIRYLRPHVKTHKTREGCLIQLGIDENRGVKRKADGAAHTAEVIGFVASTIPEVSMIVDLACQYNHKALNDILLGVPVCWSKLTKIESLRNVLQSNTKGESDKADIHLLVDHPGQVEFLEKSMTDSSKWSVFLKLNTGYNRAGTTCDQHGVDLAAKIIESPALTLKGLYSHCGHSYNISNEKEMKQTTCSDHKKIADFLEVLQNDLESRNHKSFDISNLHISVGSTPSVFCHDNSIKLTNHLELHPGNYVFYDRQQLFTGACTEEKNVACCVLALVIGHYPDRERNAIMVDAGATALTKESTPQGGMCSVMGRSDLECYRMSQEITMIRLRKDDATTTAGDENKPFPFDDFPLGSTVLLLPNHSCLAAACFEEYFVVDEAQFPIRLDAEVVDEWEPVSGWT